MILLAELEMRQKGLQDSRKEDSQRRRAMDPGQMGFPTCVSQLVCWGWFKVIRDGENASKLRGDLIENCKWGASKPLDCD